MTTFWRKTGDNLQNGTILGSLFGASIAWGSGIYDWVVEIVPTTWLYFGDYSIPIYLIAIGALIGYFVDRK